MVDAGSGKSNLPGLIEAKLVVEGGSARRLDEPPQIAGDLRFDIGWRRGQPAGVGRQRTALRNHPWAGGSLGVENQSLFDPNDGVIALRSREAYRLAERDAGYEDVRWLLRAGDSDSN